MNQPFCLDALVRVVGTSRRTPLRRFKVGREEPLALLKSVRIDLSKSLLSRTVVAAGSVDELKGNDIVKRLYLGGVA